MVFHLNAFLANGIIMPILKGFFCFLSLTNVIPLNSTTAIDLEEAHPLVSSSCPGYAFDFEADQEWAQNNPGCTPDLIFESGCQNLNATLSTGCFPQTGYSVIGTAEVTKYGNHESDHLIYAKDGIVVVDILPPQ